jgi:hypothetical protein
MPSSLPMPPSSLVSMMATGRRGWATLRNRAEIKSAMVFSAQPMHPLDHPIWYALISRQRALAEGGARARRYPPAVAPFAATADTSPESFAALHDLMSRSDQIALFTPDPVTAPAEFKVLRAATGEQMIGTPAETSGHTADIVTLGAADVPAMMELTKLTSASGNGNPTPHVGDCIGAGCLMRSSFPAKPCNQGGSLP